MIRVLYVNHTAVVSGAEHSLLVLLRSVNGSVSPVVACPEGELAAIMRTQGVPVRPIPGTNLSARLHLRHTVREAGRVMQASSAIRSIARDVRADVIHANTPRAGLMTAFSRGSRGSKPIVHVRDSIPPGRLPRLMFSLLARRVSAFIPTAQYLAAQLPPAQVSMVVPNAIEPDLFDPAASDRASARARLGLGQTEPVIAVVGQISPHKGQRDAIAALNVVRRTYADARLLLVGSVKFASAATRFDNRSYADELVILARELGVESATSFLGERTDIAEILAAVDVLLVPSWYEPFGRVALEGMIMRIPVIVTSVGGTKEVVADGVDGLVLAPRQPEAWAEAIHSLLSDPARRAAMGASGRARALADYSPAAHARQVMEVYERVLGQAMTVLGRG